jgi:hypothetical protein
MVNSMGAETPILVLMGWGKQPETFNLLTNIIRC